MNSTSGGNLRPGRITVVIPTAGRPELLEFTLGSVRAQTAIEEVAKVIVSENLSDSRSRDVCARFPDLPIEYVIQDPPLAVHMHTAWLLSQPDTEFVAFVCDDDLWSPGHLASGLSALERRPDASAFFSAFVGAESELAESGFFWAAGLLWLAAGRPQRPAHYSFDLPSMMALSWVLTPFQYSTLIGRSAAVALAAPAVAASSHSFYSDRVLCLALADAGSIIFSPMVDTLYRVYEGNWQNSQSQEHLHDLLAGYQAEVELQAQERGFDLPALWRRYLERMPAGVAPEAHRWFEARFTQKELDAYGFASLLPQAPARSSLGRRVAGRFTRAAKALIGR